MISRFAIVLCASVWVFGVSAASAQSEPDIYVRIEATPAADSVGARLQDYAAQGATSLNAFALNAGWVAIAIGPFADETEARNARRELLNAGLIPSDSFLTTRGEMGEQLFDEGLTVVAQEVEQNRVADESAATEPVKNESTAPAVSTEGVTPEEQRAQDLERARAAEAELDRDARRVLQSRLQWAGFYNGALDGLIGRGTRASISAWQEDRGFEPIGVMTPEQLEQIDREYFSVFEGLGLREVSHRDAGITLALPMDILAARRTEPPFVVYESVESVEGGLGEGVAIALISSEGGRDELAGLYQALQTLEWVPLEGERRLSGNRFVINAENAARITYAEAAIEGDQIKGFLMMWPRDDEERRTRLLATIEESFVIDPSAVLGQAEAIAWDGREMLLDGLQVRQPLRVGSGSFVSDQGHVLTASALVEGCGRVTLGRELQMRLVGEAEQGLALLETADTPIAPLDTLRFGAAIEAPADIAVAGYSFGGRLNAASVTFGTLVEKGGLNGEADVMRLELSPAEGDAGGPVLSRVGGFAGILLPAAHDAERLLPETVNYARDRDSVVAFLQAREIAVNESDIAVADVIALRDYAQNITAQISCWP